MFETFFIYLFGDSSSIHDNVQRSDGLSVSLGFILAHVNVIVTCLRMFVE